MVGSIGPAGTVALRILQRGSWTRTPAKELSLIEIMRHGLPWPGNPREVNVWRLKNFPNLWRGLWRALTARIFGLANFYGALSLVKIRKDGTIIDYGLASFRSVTDTGVGYIVDAFQPATSIELENMKFHGVGTGTNAESTANTSLQTEESTQYNPDNTRPTGTTTEGASANIYRTVATYSPDSGGTRAITEHGIFSQAATGGGVLLDRSVFSAVNLVAGSDSLQATYDLTFTSGG